MHSFSNVVIKYRGQFIMHLANFAEEKVFQMFNNAKSVLNYFNKI